MDARPDSALSPGATPLPFTSPWLLAPMDGVTDPVFRDLLLEMHAPEHLGGAFTEFVRIHQGLPSRRLILQHLGRRSHEAPVGIQFMGRDRVLMQEAADLVATMGVPLLDINFGCPARGAKKGCVGAALLDFPEEMRAIVAACVEGVRGRIPVTAKIRAGVDDDRHLEDIVAAINDSGAALLTLHCRTKKEGYDENAIDWKRLERARRCTSLPLCGNGGIHSLDEARDMRRQTGCDFVMIGRAAIANPWVFSAATVDAEESLAFLRRYHETMLGSGATVQQALARLKQMLRFWTAGQLIPDSAVRKELLRMKDCAPLFRLLEEAREG